MGKKTLKSQIAGSNPTKTMEIIYLYLMHGCISIHNINVINPYWLNKWLGLIFWPIDTFRVINIFTLGRDSSLVFEGMYHWVFESGPIHIRIFQEKLTQPTQHLAKFWPKLSDSLWFSKIWEHFEK